MKQEKERRNKPRVEGKVLIKILAEDQDFLIYTGNLSKTGMFLETHHPLGEVGDVLSMEISTPATEKKLRVKGQIMRISPPNQFGKTKGIAIHFTKLDARHSKSFDHILSAMFESKGLGCRRYIRAKTTLLMEIRTAQDAKRVIAQDVSFGGMFLKTPTEGIAVGDVLNVIIIHPTSKRKLSVDAEVMHIRRGEIPMQHQFEEGLGVQFSHLTPSRRKDLSGFLKSILFSNRKSSA